MLSDIGITEAKCTSFDNAKDLVTNIFPRSDKLRIFQRLRVTFKSSNLFFKFLLMALFSSSLLNQIPRVKKSPLDHYTGKVPGL